MNAQFIRTRRSIALHELGGLGFRGEIATVDGQGYFVPVKKSNPALIIPAGTTVAQVAEFADEALEAVASVEAKRKIAPGIATDAAPSTRPARTRKSSP